MTIESQSPTGVLPSADALLRPQTWLEWGPGLHLENADAAKNLSLFELDESGSKRLDALIVREGYFHLPQLPWNLALPAMAQTIARITQRGLVPPFCFVYDEFWMLFYRLHRILGRLLGPEYAMLPEFWAWHVDPRKGNAGWAPHRDKDFTALFPDGRPKSVTVWIPLTEATPLNGCIYVVPAHLDPTYGTPQENEWKFAHQDIRALPSPAGGLFIWNSAVLHWGARSSPLAPGPRISLAFEFQRGDVPPMNQPLLKPLTFLNFRQRLQMVCKQVLQYQKMYPLSAELKDLVDEILRRTAG